MYIQHDAVAIVHDADIRSFTYTEGAQPQRIARRAGERDHGRADARAAATEWAVVGGCIRGCVRGFPREFLSGRGGVWQ